MAHLTYSVCNFALRFTDIVSHPIIPDYTHAVTYAKTKEDIVTVARPSSTLLPDSHYSTLQRKADNIDTKELKDILDNLGRKLCYEPKRSLAYVNALNQALDTLNAVRHSILSTVVSHTFFILIRNVTRDLLVDWRSTYHLNSDDTFLLRNCVRLLIRLIDAVDNVSVLTPWLPNPSFVNAIADCMSDIDRLLDNDIEKYNFKQLTRLLDIFSKYNKRLSSKSEDNKEFERLFTATMDCLTSTHYDRAFRNLKSNTDSMTTEQKFFLVKCPAFLNFDRGSYSTKIMGQVLETLVPRYASLLDKHIRSMGEWHHSMMRAVQHLLLTVAHAEGLYTPYANGQPLRWLVEQIVRILGENLIVTKVTEKQTSPETMLIDSALNALGAFVHEPDLLAYIKQLKATPTFRSLIILPYETIVFRAYVMLSYAMDEDEIKASEKDSGRLLSNIFDSLRKGMKSLSETNINEEDNIITIKNNIALLTEAIQVLVQHDQIKSEILKQNAMPVLINSSQQFMDQSKRLVLESIGSMSFNHEAAKILRENTSFIKSIEDLQTATDNGIQKAAEKIYWNLIKEPEYLEKMIEKGKEEEQQKEKIAEIVQSNGKKRMEVKKQDYKHDMMISYCHEDKEIVYKIHDFLTDQGFTTWFDRDNMYGSAMQAMAEAVESAEFVLICMSDSYKRSIYCQAEAEYAFNCKRRLIPVIARQGYRADGWLAFLMGSRIYVDFGRFEFKKACDLLINQITLQRQNQFDMDEIDGEIVEGEPGQIRRRSTTGSIRLPPTLRMKAELANLPEEYTDRDTIESKYRTKSLNRWTRNDILDYLCDHNLHHMMPLCEVMTGPGLKTLVRVCQSEPSRLYSKLNEELRFRFDGVNLPIGVYTQFLSEMERLIGLSSETSIRTGNSVRNASIPSSEPPISWHSQINSMPILQHNASAVSMETQAPRNVRFSEQTSFQSQSVNDQPPDLIAQSLPSAEYARSIPVTHYRSDPISIDNKSRQIWHSNRTTYRRTSHAYRTQFVKETYFPWTQ